MKSYKSKKAMAAEYITQCWAERKSIIYIRLHAKNKFGTSTATVMEHLELLEEYKQEKEGLN